jgi:P4 family phage/plasmid primase-like protien
MNIRIEISKPVDDLAITQIGDDFNENEIGLSQNSSIHPLIEFARALDANEDSRFNIESYTDQPKGEDKPLTDNLLFRRAELTLEGLKALIPELHRRNAQGAGIFISVNRCKGHRCFNNVVKIRAVHADVDEATDAQRAYLLQKLPPSIVVTSSEQHRLQLYWLLEDESEQSKTEVGELNKILAHDYGADIAATDISRLLRAPGFKHMKYRSKGLMPVVTASYTGQKYSLAEVQAAFPTISYLQRTAQPKTEAVNADLSKIEKEILKNIQANYTDLWRGNWSKSVSNDIFSKPFNSQSEADLSLASRIARELAKKGVQKNQLAESTERIFNESGLAIREKWHKRDDYRRSTINKAVENLTDFPIHTISTSAATNEEDETHKDVKNAAKFASMYRDKFIYVPTVNKWHQWNGFFWTTCEHGEEVQAAKEVCKKLLEEAGSKLSFGDPKGVALVKEAVNAHTLPRIEAMIKLAMSENGMSATTNELDAHPYLLGVRNGVVDLKNQSLLVPQPSMLITKQCNAEFIEDPTCPQWIKFLHDVFQGDDETIDAVQILLGYTLIGQVLDELLIICYGFGANGKSVFNNVVAKVLGDYAQMAPSSMLSVRRNDDNSPRNDLAGIKGSRYLSINELQAGDRLDERVVKSIAGREPISARFLFGEFFTFMPTFKAWVRTNHKPIIVGDDTGIWRRIVLIPFTRTFTKEEQDPHLEEKLLQERDGILGWILEGAKKYQENGIVMSPRMQAEVNSYRKDSDVLGEFLEDKTQRTALSKVEQKSLYFVYKHWCENNGIRAQSKKSFSQRLKERGFPDSKSGSTRYYLGLELIDEFGLKLEVSNDEPTVAEITNLKPPITQAGCGQDGQDV